MIERSAVISRYQPLTISSKAILRRLIGLLSWPSASVLGGSALVMEGELAEGIWIGDGNSTGPRWRGVGSIVALVMEEERW